MYYSYWKKKHIFVLFYSQSQIYFVCKNGQKGKDVIHQDFAYIVLNWIEDITQVEKKIDKKGERFDSAQLKLVWERITKRR